MVGRKLVMIAGAFALVLANPVVVSAKTKSDSNFVFPKDKPIKIILFRPDIEVATLGASGVPTPNPDWTADARRYLGSAFAESQQVKDAQITPLAELAGEDAAYAAEYQSLFKAVGSSVMIHNYVAKLPTKKLPDGKYKFDWTLGSGAKHLGEIGGGNYGLFVYSYDAHATAGRKMFQFFMAAMVGYMPAGGQHYSYASLVDLETGNIVWFNFYANKKGDIRTAEGAKERAAKLLSTLPLREGQVVAKLVKK
jgi:hypothetical protein